MTRTLLPGWLDRGSITLLTGASHAGKTTLLAQLVQQFSPFINNEQGNFLNTPVPSGLAVAYILAGDAKPWSDTALTFEDIGAVLDPTRLSTTLDYPVHNPHTSTDLLIAELDRLPLSDLYIIEGLTAFVSPVNVVNYHAPLQGLKSLTHWAVERSVALLGTHHLAKLDGASRPRRPLDRVLGTTSLVGNVSHCAILETPEEVKASTYKLTLYHRRSKTQTLTLSRADTPGGPFALAVDEEREAFLESIPPQPDSVILKKLFEGCGEVQAKLWIDELVREGKIQGTGRGGYQRV